MNFTYKIYLPIKGRYYRFKSFTGVDYLTMGKYIQNNDQKKIIDNFKKIIKKCCVEKIKIKELTTIDMFCVLLNLRIMCVSQLFEYEGVSQNKSEKIKQKQRLDLYDVLDSVTNYNINLMSNVELAENCWVNIGVPVGLVVKDVDTLILDTLKSIKIKDKVYEIETLSIDEKQQLLDQLPGDVLTTITNYIKRIDTEYEIEVFPTTADNELREIKLKLFDNSMYSFLLAMYNSNLQEQYYVRYIMVKRLKFLLDDVNKMPPIDTQNYIDLYREELEEQRKAQESQSGQQTGNSSMMLPTPSDSPGSAL